MKILVQPKTDSKIKGAARCPSLSDSCNCYTNCKSYVYCPTPTGNKISFNNLK